MSYRSFCAVVLGPSTLFKSVVLATAPMFEAIIALPPRHIPHSITAHATLKARAVEA
jgi:hypothetical protein